MNTESFVSENPSHAPLFDKAPEVEREPWDHSELRSLDPRAISPTPVSRGSAHVHGVGVIRRDLRRGPFLKLIARNPAIVLGASFMIGLVSGVVLLRRK